MRSIITTFNNTQSRDAFLDKIKTYIKTSNSNLNQLNTADLGYSQERNRIYISEHLTQRGKFLLAQTKKFASVHHFKYTWVNSGRILLKKTDESNIITIHNVRDFERIKRQVI